MGFKWALRIMIFVAFCFASACANTSDAPEVPPTMVLGAGIFDYEEGAINCVTVATEPEVQIRCYAAMSEEDSSEVSGFDEGIIDHQWQPLHINHNGETMIVTNFVPSENGVSAVYSIPSTYQIDPAAQGVASLVVIRSDFQTRNKLYQYTYLPPTPTQTPLGYSGGQYYNPMSSPNPNQ